MKDQSNLKGMLEFLNNGQILKISIRKEDGMYAHITPSSMKNNYLFIETCLIDSAITFRKLMTERQILKRLNFK